MFVVEDAGTHNRSCPDVILGQECGEIAFMRSRIKHSLTITALNDGMSFARSGTTGEIMGEIIKFPADASARRRSVDAVPAVRDRSAQVFILPVIRIERQIDDSNGCEPGEGTAPRRRRKRRARS